MTEPDFVDELITEGGSEFAARVNEAFVRRHKIREQLANLGISCPANNEDQHSEDREEGKK